MIDGSKIFLKTSKFHKVPITPIVNGSAIVYHNLIDKTDECLTDKVFLGIIYRRIIKLTIRITTKKLLGHKNYVKRQDICDDFLSFSGSGGMLFNKKERIYYKQRILKNIHSILKIIFPKDYRDRYNYYTPDGKRGKVNNVLINYKLSH